MAEDIRTADQKAVNWLGVVLTIYLCALLAYLVWALVTGEVQATFRDVVIGIVGFVTAKLSTIYDFCFGTSATNKKQGETIATQAETARKAQEALAPIAAAVAPVVAAAAGNGAGVQPAGGSVVLQPGDHVDVAAVLLKPKDLDQAIWDGMTDAQKAAEIAKRTSPSA